MIVPQPFHYLAILGMQHEFTAFQAYDGFARDALAAHYGLYLIQAQALVRLLPDGAMPALGLADGRGVYHQLAQLFVPRPGHVVQIQQPVMDIISKFVHQCVKLVIFHIKKAGTMQVPAFFI